jgi:hypothetical protein
MKLSLCNFSQSPSKYNWSKKTLFSHQLLQFITIITEFSQKLQFFCVCVVSFTWIEWFHKFKQHSHLEKYETEVKSHLNTKDAHAVLLYVWQVIFVHIITSLQGFQILTKFAFIWYQVTILSKPSKCHNTCISVLGTTTPILL